MPSSVSNIWWNGLCERLFYFWESLRTEQQRFWQQDYTGCDETVYIDMALSWLHQGHFPLASDANFRLQESQSGPLLALILPML